MRLFVCFLLILSLPVITFAQCSDGYKCEQNKSSSSFTSEIGKIKITLNGDQYNPIFLVERAFKNPDPQAMPVETLKLFMFNGYFRAIRVSKKINRISGSEYNYSRVSLLHINEKIKGEYAGSKRIAYPVDLVQERYWDCKNLYQALKRHYVISGEVVRFRKNRTTACPETAKEDIVRLFRYQLESYFYKPIKTFAD